MGCARLKEKMMARIVVVGGTGYAGRHIVREAAARGHHVVSFSRKAPVAPVVGVDYQMGDVLQSGIPSSLLDGADVVVETLSPRGPLAGKLVDVVAELAKLTQAAGARLAVVGGAGSLQVAPGGPLLMDSAGFPAEYRAEAQELGAVLRLLKESDSALDWFFVSPAAGFGQAAE